VNPPAACCLPDAGLLKSAKLEKLKALNPAK
jgi:hypothetical protein